MFFIEHRSKHCRLNALFTSKNGSKPLLIRFRAVLYHLYYSVILAVNSNKKEQSRNLFFDLNR